MVLDSDNRKEVIFSENEVGDVQITLVEGRDESQRSSTGASSAAHEAICRRGGQVGTLTRFDRFDTDLASEWRGCVVPKLYYAMDPKKGRVVGVLTKDPTIAQEWFGVLNLVEVGGVDNAASAKNKVISTLQDVRFGVSTTTPGQRLSER